MAVLGAVLVMPYAFELNKDKLAKAPMSMQKLAVLSIVQSLVLFAVVTFIGLLAANHVGLLIVSDLSIVPMAIVLGVLAGVLLMGIEHFVFTPRLPDVLHSTERQIALWKRFAASFYGGISEEVLMRLFLMSGITWLLGLFWQTTEGLPASGAYVVAILISTIVFGLGHLPATAAMTRLTPLIIVRAILLNGIYGILCGLIFWQYGLIAAMVAHFSGDIVIHVIVPLIYHPMTSHDKNPMSQPA
jgi:hypothetical protein